MPMENGPWAPFEPTANDPWDLAKAAHLHRRAGFGAGRTELLRDVKDGPTASVDRFLRPPPMSDDQKQVLDCLRQGVLDIHDTDRNDRLAPGYPFLKAWWLYRVLYDPDPLREKMTLFWH